VTTHDGTYDEALERFHATGPEFDGWLSNHGPMVVEAMARRGAGPRVHAWTDRYSRRLEGPPEGTAPVDDWQAALGDPARLGDWLVHFDRAVRDEPWEQTLATWWPRLLPGIAAGATHGVIRAGHAVEALREEVTAPRLAELGQALGYWAARWHPVPSAAPAGSATAAGAVEAAPRVPDQTGGIGYRLSQLDHLADWPDGATGLRGPLTDDDVPGFLTDVVAAVVDAYPRLAVGQPTMLVHAATAPNAVRRALPSLPRDQWRPSADAAWTATAAVLAAYAPAPEARTPPRTTTPDDPWQLALDDGGEHVLKLADTALDVAARIGDDRVALAVAVAVGLDA
jgi:hypothetical protein